MHLNARIATPATFLRGGMMYTMTKLGNDIIVKVTDSYTVSSMLTRSSSDNVKRVAGYQIPLSNTSVEFNFTLKNVNFNYKKH